jgi:glycosyltransferase involved in cell wall biosynthesis
VFKRLEAQYKMTKHYNFKLNVYIQGVDKAVQSNITLKDTDNISIHFNNYSYSEIIALINENDLVIHLGDHEGLGLGFFEALNNNKTLITLNTYPNSEYIIDGLNGYLINCNFENLKDNNEGITNRAVVNLDHYYKLMEKILANTYRPTLYNLIMANKNIVNNYDKNFVRVLKNI